MLRRFCLLALVAILSLAARSGWAIQYASIVIDAKTGKVLHAVNPDERAYPASLTKMMTLYLTFEALRSKTITLDQKLPVSRLAERRSPSKLGLRRGQRIGVGDAISALVTKSANDVATVVAEALGGTEVRFAQRMTAKARQLGMTRTTFRNASGLPNRGQVSTARDMAKLAVALQRDFPEYYQYFSLKTFEYGGQTYRNHNRLLARYRGTDGIKTGYVHESGFNIAASVERNGHRLICVVLGGKSAARRDRHAAKLLDNAFETLAEAPAVAGDGTGAKAIDFAGVRPAPPAAEVVSEPVASWGVQVGAFNRYAPAHLAATRAARKARVLLGTRVAIVPSEGDDGQVFRARLIGLSESQARDACRMLKRRKVGCLVVRSGEETAEGDRD
jgi:D-alanyl-D-alanine carboxypeptidase